MSDSLTYEPYNMFRNFTVFGRVLENSLLKIDQEIGEKHAIQVTVTSSICIVPPYQINH